MHRYAVRLMKRNYAKRFMTLAVIFVALVLLTAVLTPLLLRRQLKALDNALEAAETETADTTGTENTGADTAGTENTGDTAPTEKKKDEEHRIKAALHSLPEVGIAAKIILPLLALALIAVAVLFRVTEAEWLWRAAVTHRLNRALWPMLGALLGVLAVLALLVVVNDPKRLEKQA